MSTATFLCSDVMQNKQNAHLYLLLTFQVQERDFVLQRTLRAHCALTVQVLVIRSVQVGQHVGQFTPKSHK